MGGKCRFYFYGREDFLILLRLIKVLYRRGENCLQNTHSGTSVWRPQSRYTVSRIECRIKFPQNQRCRAKIALHPPKSRCRTFLRTPLSHFPLIRSRQGARRAGGGYRGTFGFRKRIALQGGVAATVTPVALLCATKFLGPCLIRRPENWTASIFLLLSLTDLAISQIQGGTFSDIRVLQRLGLHIFAKQAPFMEHSNISFI